MIVALGFAIVVAVASSLDRPMKVAVANTEAKSATEPLVRSDPGVDPWMERDIPPPKMLAPVEQRAAPRPPPQPDPPPAPPPAPIEGPQPVSVPKPEQRPEPEPDSDPKPDRAPEPQPQLNRALPTEEQIQAANQPRQYRLPPGAIMSLSIPAIGLEDVPILNSETTGALDRGVVHLPDTSLPWSNTPHTNVYLAGHRLGWPGTGSHLVFYRLDELDGGRGSRCAVGGERAMSTGLCRALWCGHRRDG